jgi:hypothetical protein
VVWFGLVVFIKAKEYYESFRRSSTKHQNQQKGYHMRRLLYNLHQCLLALLERPQCSYCEHRNWTERGVIGHMTVTHGDELEDENERFLLEIERDL